MRGLIACCIIFDASPQEILPEVNERVAREILTMAYTLCNIRDGAESVRTQRRAEALELLITRIHNHTSV